MAIKDVPIDMGVFYPEPPELPEGLSAEDVRRGYNRAPLDAGKEPFFMDRAEKRRERHRLKDLYGDDFL